VAGALVDAGATALDSATLDADASRVASLEQAPSARVAPAKNTRELRTFCCMNQE